MTPVIGYVGLGAMGLPFAGHLAAAGCQVVGFNRSDRPYAAARKAGLKIASTLQDCIQAADLLFTCLPTPEAVAQVYDRVRKPGLICADNSTIGPDQARALHRMLSERGVGFVECPMIGLAERAERGDVTLVMSGEDAHVAAVAAVARHGARAAHPVGGPGAASIVKVVQNGLGFVQMAGIAEALTIVERAGVDVDAFITLVGDAGGLAASPVFRAKAPHMRNLPYRSSAGFGIASKDLNLSAEIAAGLGVDAPVTTAAAALFRAGVEMGLGPRDFAAIIRVVEARTAAG